MAPLREGWLGLSVFGGLARTVADSALVMDAIHGALPSDLDPAPSFTGRYAEAAAREPGRLRIAVSRKVAPGLIARVSADQRGAWEQMATALSGLGHEVVGRDPNYGTIQIEFLQTWLRGIYEESLLVPDRSQLETLTKEMAGAGRIFVPERRRDALRAKRARTIARILALWDEVDVLMTPGLATTAIRAEGGYGQHLPLAIDRAGRFTPFTAPFNVTGQPAISIPAGIGSDGLPLSVQLVGRPGAEDMLYSLAGQIETARPWADRKPALA
jgi:amidase